VPDVRTAHEHSTRPDERGCVVKLLLLYGYGEDADTAADTARATIGAVAPPTDYHTRTLHDVAVVAVVAGVALAAAAAAAAAGGGGGIAAVVFHARDGHRLHPALAPRLILVVLLHHDAIVMFRGSMPSSVV
jgi:hypothetical protein